MDAAAEIGRNPVCKHDIQPGYGDDEQADASGAAEPVSHDQILRRGRGQGNIHFPFSVDHVCLGGANLAVNTPRPSRGTRIESCDFIVLIGDP